VILITGYNVKVVHSNSILNYTLHYVISQEPDITHADGITAAVIN